MHSETDETLLFSLIERVARTDEAALRQLYDVAAPRLYGLALRICVRKDWAEDALQEAFLTIWRSAGDYRSTLSPPMSWLGIIVRSRALDQVRRHKADRDEQSVEIDEVLAESLESEAPDPVSVALASQQARELQRCLQKLEASQRQAVTLAYLRDLSHTELAESLRVPLGTVKTWIRRGLSQLKGCMARFN